MLFHFSAVSLLGSIPGTSVQITDVSKTSSQEQRKLKATLFCQLHLHELCLPQIFCVMPLAAVFIHCIVVDCNLNYAFSVRLFGCNRECSLHCLFLHTVAEDWEIVVV